MTIEVYDYRNLCPVPEYLGWFVCEEGLLWSTRKNCTRSSKIVGVTPRITKGYIGNHGYLGVAYKKGDGIILIHRLVLLTFYGTSPELENCTCRHLDGNRINNRPENLRWGTMREQGKDRILHGTTLTGEKNHRAKLTEKDVRDIRRRFDEIAPGIRKRDLIKDFAAEYGVSEGAIESVVYRENWKHVGMGV